MLPAVQANLLLVAVVEHPVYVLEHLLKPLGVGIRQGASVLRCGYVQMQQFVLLCRHVDV